ncbi:MAG TPA: hypothetical protein PLX02_02760 [Syntrophorhabdaceae bacterium]|nr:hypothetical protein [Syntrophorhabdaceae bacterium]
MKRGSWFPTDKRIASFLPKDRSFNTLEAVISLQMDVNEGREGTIAGYAALWGWSRDKVRSFITPLKAGVDHYPDRKSTGNRHPIRLIFRDLEEEDDSKTPPPRQKDDPTKESKSKKDKKNLSFSSSPSKKPFKGGSKDEFPIDEEC